MRRALLAVPFALAFSFAAPADAGLIVTIEDGSGPATPGSTGNFFDVVLRHVAPEQSKVDVNNYGVDLILPAGSGVTFRAVTPVTTGTALPYIFSNIGGGLGQLTTINTGLRLAFNDAAQTPGAAELVTLGEAFGLGRVFYDVAAGATPGSVPVKFLTPTTVPPGATDLGDSLAGAVPFTAVDGAIAIAPAAAPEPGSCVLLALVGAGAFGVRRLRRGKAEAEAV